MFSHATKCRYLCSSFGDSIFFWTFELLKWVLGLRERCTYVCLLAEIKIQNFISLVSNFLIFEVRIWNFKFFSERLRCLGRREFEKWISESSSKFEWTFSYASQIFSNNTFVFRKWLWGDDELTTISSQNNKKFHFCIVYIISFRYVPF